MAWHIVLSGWDMAVGFSSQRLVKIERSYFLFGELKEKHSTGLKVNTAYGDKGIVF